MFFARAMIRFFSHYTLVYFAFLLFPLRRASDPEEHPERIVVTAIAGARRSRRTVKRHGRL